MIPNVSFIGNKRPTSHGSTSLRKNDSISQVSFKHKSTDGHENANSFSLTQFLERPKATRRVQYCPAKESMEGCWYFIEPSTFNICSETYFRDKKKYFTPNHVSFSPFGVHFFVFHGENMYEN